MGNSRQKKPDLSNPMSRSRRGKNSGFSRLLILGLAAFLFMMVMVYLQFMFKIVAGGDEDAVKEMNTVQADSSSESLKIAAGGDEEAVKEAKIVKADSSSESLQNKADSSGESRPAENKASFTNGGTLVLNTKYGPIRIVIRPELSRSPESLQYLDAMLDSSCRRCNFYRAEKLGILQGALSDPDVKHNEVLGKCPENAKEPKHCPKHDLHCGCHGPVMTRGMVGWAGGGGGPDFFIDTYPGPQTHWETQHTVWGEIQDDESFAVIDKIYTLPVKVNYGMHMLERPITITPERSQ